MHICDIQDVTMVAKIECRENFMQRLLYRLEGSESYQVKDGTVTAAYGVAVTAVARWLRPVRYTDGVRHWRFARLEVICAGKGYLFAIPVNRIGKPFDLPGLEFNETEVKLLHLIADELRRPKDWREEVIKIRDRSKENLKANRTIAEQLPTNTSNAQLMLREPWVAEVMLTAVLTNLRPWFPRGEIPGFVTNFVVPSRGSDGSTEEALQGLLRSFAFLGDGQRGFLQELEFDSKEELCRWRDDGTQFSL